MLNIEQLLELNGRLVEVEVISAEKRGDFDNEWIRVIGKERGKAPKAYNYSYGHEKVLMPQPGDKLTLVTKISFPDNANGMRFGYSFDSIEATKPGKVTP